MDAKGRCVGGRRRRCGRGVRVGQPVGAAWVEVCRRARRGLPGGAPSALHRHLPMRGVDFGPGLEDLKSFASVRCWHRPSPAESISIMRGTEDCRMKTYVVHRLDAMAEFPFAHPSVKGLLSMVPPQARPTQPTSFRAATWRTISYGIVAGFGTAVRKAMTLGLLYLYCALY